MDKAITKTERNYGIRGLVRQAYVITEWKDGCVYRTKPVGLVICRSAQPCLQSGQLGSVSTKRSKLYSGPHPALADWDGCF